MYQSWPTLCVVLEIRSDEKKERIREYCRFHVFLFFFAEDELCAAGLLDIPTSFSGGRVRSACDEVLQEDTEHWINVQSNLTLKLCCAERYISCYDWLCCKYAGVTHKI